MSTHSDQPGQDANRAFPDLPGIPGFVGYAMRTAGDGPAELHAAEAALLHPRAVPERQETFRLGRLAAHAALQMIERDSAPILSGENREPIWPRGVAGSISHAKGIGVAMVAPATETDGIGIDIETLRSAPELEDQVPRPEERAWLDLAPPPQRTSSLLALFSAKESLFKAFFPRVERFFGFQDASLVPNPSGFTGRLVVDLDRAYPPTRTFHIACAWSGTTVLTWVVLPKTR